MKPILSTDLADGQLSKRHASYLPAVVFCLAAVVTACEPLPADAGLRISEVLHSDQCAVEQPTAYVIESASQWRSLQTRDGRFLPEPSEPGPDASPEPVLGADETLVVIAAGQQPSTGYRVIVDTYDWQRTQDALILQVKLDSPPADALQATVLTSPCSVVSLRNYQGIEQVQFVGLKTALSVRLPLPETP